MSQNNYSYDTKSLKGALLAVGLKKGDIVFSHVGMGFLGYPSEGKGLDSMFKVICDAFFDVLGPEGTWLVPTYTYSFCRGEDYDVQNSPSTVGLFTEKFRKLPGVQRSEEPIFSVAGMGLKAKELFSNLPDECFGKDCIYDRLVKHGASICNIGVGFRYATFVHYVEQLAGVPYRFMKTFKGSIINNGAVRKNVSMHYYVRTGLDDQTTFPDLRRLEKEAREAGKCKSHAVGRGEVTLIKCKDLLDLCVAGIKKDPWYLAKGQII